jgi:hypothetical protein
MSSPHVSIARFTSVPLVLVLAMLAVASAAFAQIEPTKSQTDHCRQQKQLAAIETARNLEELSMLRKQSGATSDAAFFIAYRAFELKQSPENAANLLKLTPQTEREEVARYAIDGHNCYEVTDKEYSALDSMYDGLSPLLARAVMQAPQLMDKYVSYSLLATMDVHSDYPQQMVSVCRAFHPQFINAVSRLSEENRSWMRKRIFNPERCKSLYKQEE